MRRYRARRYSGRRGYRSRNAYRGRGDYRSVLKKVARYTLRGAGAVLGGAMGAARGFRVGKYPGAAIGAYSGGRSGWNAGASASRALGLGDYAVGRSGMSAVKRNRLMGGGTALRVNASSSNFTGDIVLSHREFIGSVSAKGATSGASDFEIRQFALNPGLSSSFPWLSQIAQNFTMYQWQGLIFEYIPTSGDYGSSGSNALGKVVMATQYDPDAPPFSSSVEMQNYDYAISGKPSAILQHGVETKRIQMPTNMLYVRTGPTTKSLPEMA